MDPEDELSLEGLPETVDEDASNLNSKILLGDLKIPQTKEVTDPKTGKPTQIPVPVPQGYWDRHSSVNSKAVGKWFFPTEKDKQEMKQFEPLLKEVNSLLSIKKEAIEEIKVENAKLKAYLEPNTEAERIQT